LNSPKFVVIVFSLTPPKLREGHKFAAYPQNPSNLTIVHFPSIRGKVKKIFRRMALIERHFTLM
jgi:hypothetical protein